MKLTTTGLALLKATTRVIPGNVYPAFGRRFAGVAYWVVVSTNETAAHLLGFNKDGNVCSTASYLHHTLESRSCIGFVPEITNLILRVEP